jgi:tRNA nucleotidyltransferase (CCA-adding enzyme)
VARLPVPGTELTAADDEAVIRAAIPAPVFELLQTLWSNGHAAYVVGGSLRDVLSGREPADWDLASDALPERVQELIPDAAYENRFGTVGVRRGDDVYDITTFRSDHDYADFRRPHRVEFGESIELDLARRDFTCNAMAWGKGRGAVSADGAGGGSPELVDPFGGRADTAARLLRAVGDPRRRFEEDALRMVRAVRLAAVLGFGIEAATLAGIQARAELVGHLSGERIATELDNLLMADRPSVGLRLLSDTGLLAGISPELAAQRGIPQNKVDGEDLWDHTLRSVDAAPVSRPIVRLAALVHDIGKPATFADGHFLGHDSVGAELADAWFDRLHSPRAVRDRVVHLVRNHMFSFEPQWSSAAVRRFIAKMSLDGTAPEAIEELILLREADNVGSGLPRDGGGLDELRARIAAAYKEGVVLDRRGLAIDGDDLMTELGVVAGPRLGAILDGLLTRVRDDPALNDRPTLLLVAQTMLAEDS